MPKKATEIGLPSQLNVMLYGDFGVGKTTFATTFPKPILFFDIDDRHQTYAGVEGIEYETYKDTGRRPKAFKQFMDDLKKYQEDSKYKTVVLDSISALTKILKYDIIGRVGTSTAANEGLTLQQWGQVTERMEEIFEILRGYDTHTVIISHPQMFQDEISGEIKTLTMLIGKKFPQKAPIFFDEIYQCFTERNRDTDREEYLIRTQSTRRDPARTSMNLRDEKGKTIPILDEKEPQDFRHIMNKVEEARKDPEEFIKKVKKERGIK